MTEKHDHPARPEQPGEGGFEEGQETRPDDDERVGQFSDGNEKLPDDQRVGQFSDGNEELPDDGREGSSATASRPTTASRDQAAVTTEATSVSQDRIRREVYREGRHPDPSALRAVSQAARGAETMAQQMHNFRLQGLQHEVARAALAEVAREEIDELIDTSLASDEEKSALRLYSWSFLSRFELRRLALERLRDLSLQDEDQAPRADGEQRTG